jgi:hypothetical protein
MSTDIPVKDLPEKVTQSWKKPDAPDGRHLTTDLIPFGEFVKLRKRAGDERRGLFPTTPIEKEHMDALHADPVMKKVKDDYNYTAWSMEPDSITFLKDVIEMYKPRVVLELGSGISTSILSAKLKEVWKGSKDKPVYVTIDQSDDYLEQTLKLVEKAGTKDITKPLIFPITYYKVGEQGEDGKVNALACYDFDEKKLFEATGGLRPDMIIVDGPTGGGVGGFPFARMLTAPILSMYAKPDALFCMDDAYRDTEIKETQSWIESQTLHVLGVKAVGKGLMMGLIMPNGFNIERN